MMHRKYGGSSMATKNARSATPEGFAYGFFMANNESDHQARALSYQFDRLDSALIRGALSAGLSAQGIRELIEDAYYFDLDDAAAERALQNWQ